MFMNPDPNLPPIITEFTPPVIPPASAQRLAPGGRPRKKMRWWVKALMALAALLLVGGTLAVTAIGYVHSLVQTYTSIQPEKLPVGDDSPTAVQELFTKFEMFKEALDAHRAEA